MADKIGVQVSLNLDLKKDKTTIKSTDFNIFTGGRLASGAYKDRNGVPNKMGTKAVTQVLVHGLIANIHFAHQREYKDSAQHLREIIAELEKGFIALTDVSQAEFGE